MEKPARSEAALHRFEAHMTVPMLLMSLAHVPLFLVPLMFTLSPVTERSLMAAGWFIWGGFALEYVVRLYLAPERRSFVLHNKLDLLVVVLPFLRPLRLVRSLRSAQVTAQARAGVYMGRFFGTLRRTFVKHGLYYALAFTVAMSVFAALAVTALEQGDPDANIRSIPDGLWWAVTTVTTVGYGDTYPVTAAGRILGAALMIMGVALFGFLAGALATAFLGASATEAADEGGVPPAPAREG